jgi:hypothetical protein
MTELSENEKKLNLVIREGTEICKLINRILESKSDSQDQQKFLVKQISHLEFAIGQKDVVNLPSEHLANFTATLNLAKQQI